MNNWKRMTDHFECSCCHVAFEHIRIALMTGAKLIRGTCQGIVPFFQKSFFQFHLSAPSKSTQTSHPPNSTPACHPAMATSKGTRPWHPSYGILQCLPPFLPSMFACFLACLLPSWPAAWLPCLLACLLASSRGTPNWKQTFPQKMEQ